MGELSESGLSLSHAIEVPKDHEGAACSNVLGYRCVSSVSCIESRCTAILLKINSRVRRRM